MTVLDKIIARTRHDLEDRKSRRPLDQIKSEATEAPLARDFAAALKMPGSITLIAEIKKASPSAGVIREDFDPVGIARTYAEHGAGALSVLTDVPFFQGDLAYLTAVRPEVELPLLRKDFLIDPYQLYEARAAGADAVLLIAEVLDDASLKNLLRETDALGMHALVELYELQNLRRILEAGAQIVGVNNRNLHTFAVDLEHTLRLRDQVPSDRVFVSESGIRTRADVERLQQAGVDAMLVGETLMRSPDIGAKIDELLGKEN